MTATDIYFNIALDVIPQDELEELLEEFGYKETPSVALIYKAFEEKGDKFAREFALLAKESASSDLGQAKFRAAAGLINKGTGSAKNNYTKPLTDAEKQARFNNGMNIFNSISDVIVKFAASAGDIIGYTNGTFSWINQAQVEAYRKQAEEEKTKRYLIMGGVGLVILIIVCFMMYMMFGKR
ncbi:MAG: hypothetical protein IJS05_07775 [Paludibacteraceae bacterium]|nr:hypothetical protein [Paludibacteraceae bacterium]